MYLQQRPVKIFFCSFYSPKLFHDRLSRPLEMLLKGEAKYIVGGRALRQDFTLELTAPEAIGKVRIGGKMFKLISTWNLFKYKRIRCQVFDEWYSVICLSPFDL